MLDLSRVSNAALALQPLPPSVSRLVRIISVNDPDLDEVVNVITYDQALTVRVLRLANSASSASRSVITSARGAVIRIGMPTVLGLAMATGVQDLFGEALPQFGMPEGKLWRHSVATAIASEVIAPVHGGHIPPETFSAALLHDIGLLILCRFIDADLQESLRRACEEGQLSLHEAETEILGAHHGEVGAMTAQHWGLPDGIVQGILHHDDPDRSTLRVVDLVHLANVIAKRIGEGGRGGDEESMPEVSAMERLALPMSALDELCSSTREQFDEVASLYI